MGSVVCGKNIIPRRAARSAAALLPPLRVRLSVLLGRDIDPCLQGLPPPSVLESRVAAEQCAKCCILGPLGCYYAALTRQSLREAYNLVSDVDDVKAHYLCGPCAICQERNELLLLAQIEQTKHLNDAMSADDVSQEPAWPPQVVS